MHGNKHSRLKEVIKIIQTQTTRLISDLDESDKFDRTLAITASGFSLDMLTEGRPRLKLLEQVEVLDMIEDMKNHGMHRHFTDGCSTLLFGGGIRRGHVYGKTDDNRPSKIVENPIKIDGIHQTT